MFRNGNASPYGGPRKTEGIISYMNKQKLPAVSQVTAESLDDFKKKDNFVVVGFVAEDDATSLDNLRKFGETSRDSLVVGVSHDAKLASSLGAKFPSVVAFRQFDDPMVVHQSKSKKLTFDEIKHFTSLESIPLIAEVSAENFLQYVESGLPLAYFFVQPDAPTRVADVEKLAAVAKEFRGKVNMVWIDAVKFASHAKALNLPGDKWPAFAVQSLETGAKFPLADLGKDVAKSVRSFLKQFAAGKLTPSLKSAPIPVQNTSVIEVVTDEFHKYVFDDSRDVLFELYAPWCGHCKRLAPTYERLADIYAADADASKRVTVAKMDGTANDIPTDADIVLTGFPTILLKKAGKNNRKFITYEGDRTLESLIDFVATHGTHKASVSVSADDKAVHDEL